MPSKIDDPILKRLRQSFDCTLGQREQAAITCRELTPIIIAASTTVSSPRKTICITSNRFSSFIVRVLIPIP